MIENGYLSELLQLYNVFKLSVFFGPLYSNAPQICLSITGIPAPPFVLGSPRTTWNRNIPSVDIVFPNLSMTISATFHATTIFL